MSVCDRHGVQLDPDEWDTSGMADLQDDLQAIVGAIFDSRAFPQAEQVRLVRSLVHMTEAAFPEAAQ